MVEKVSENQPKFDSLFQFCRAKNMKVLEDLQISCHIPSLGTSYHSQCYTWPPRNGSVYGAY